MSRTVLRVKSIALCVVSAVALTYLSLVVPGHVTAVCGDLGTPIYCSVLAYGFPLPFWHSPTKTDTFDRYDVPIGGITWHVKDGCFQKSSSARRSSW